MLTGWGVRPYNWTASATLQHELHPGVGLTANYYRRWYGNYFATDNLAVTPSEYDPFCVTAPVNDQLPGGGGFRVCDYYDIKPESFGRVNNLITSASNFGRQSEVYNGFDISINASFGRGGRLAGGVSAGQTVTDNCFVVDSPQQAQPGFCRVTYQMIDQLQLKLNGTYPLPWGLLASAVFQNLPGIPVTGIPAGNGLTFGNPIAGASYVASNAEVVPSLGRNLGACGAQTTCTATVTVNLLPAYAQFEDRLTQLDVRLAKVFRIRDARLQGMFDVYNVFNASNVLAQVTRVGPIYRRPTQILPARLFKVGVQFDF